MASGEWKRDPLTGLTDAKMDTLPSEIFDGYAINRAAFPGATIFCVSSLCALAPEYTPRYVRDTILTNPGSHFHLYPIRSDNGHTLSLATAPNSFRAGLESWKAAKAQAHLPNLRQNQVKYKKFDV